MTCVGTDHVGGSSIELYGGTTQRVEHQLVLLQVVHLAGLQAAVFILHHADHRLVAAHLVADGEHLSDERDGVCHSLTAVVVRVGLIAIERQFVGIAHLVDGVSVLVGHRAVVCLRPKVADGELA